MLAEAIFVVGTYTILFMGGMNAATGNEPHYSLRDGCEMKATKQADGQSPLSYAHCKSLPSVYSGKDYSKKS